MSRIKATLYLVVVVLLNIPEAVVQAKLTISPSEVVLTSSSPPSTTFTCAFDSGASVQDVYNMQILRQRETDNSETPLAELKGSVGTAAFVQTAPADIVNRASVSGQIAASASELVLTISTTDIDCSDRGHYFCTVSYQDTSNVDQSGGSNQTLQLYALPVNGTLSATKNGINLAGGTSANQANVQVGETVQFSCLTKIGSDNATIVRWRRTSEIGTTDNLITYIPPVGSHSTGDPSFSSNECTYSRQATMTYNVTSFDANRDNNLAFQCYVSVVPPNGQGTYEVDSDIFYINPIDPDATDSSASSGPATAGGSNTGAIVGGVIGGLVLIVLIVLLVYFLWYRRRDDGESYRTKEDRVGNNSNIVPNTMTEDQYATVNKERRRGHENPGLDDRHTPRTRIDDHWYDEDSRGRTNIGIDYDNDDDYLRDGAPGINHMGMDPHNGSLGTGV